MTRLLVDSSVLIKWWHAEGESQVLEARAIARAHVAAEVQAHILDLALYESGNVLSRALRWPPRDVADQLDDLLLLCGPPVSAAAEWLRDAARLAARHDLTYYDAMWAAAARGLSVPLVSADRQLCAAGLAESPAQTVRRLRLPVR